MGGNSKKKDIQNSNIDINNVISEKKKARELGFKSKMTISNARKFMGEYNPQDKYSILDKFDNVVDKIRELQDKNSNISKIISTSERNNYITRYKDCLKLLKDDAKNIGSKIDFNWGYNHAILKE